MPAIRKLPFIDVLVVGYLENDAPLAALLAGPGDAALVSTRLPAGFASGDRHLQVVFPSRGELDPATHHLDRAVVQINAYGADDEDAYALAAEAMRALLELPIPGTFDDAVVTAADRLTGPVASRDTSTNPPAPRYVGSVALTVHPR